MKNQYKLIIFDVDGTLTNIKNSWKELHKIFGTWYKEETKNLINLYKNKKINYEEFCKREIDIFSREKLAENTILSKIEEDITIYKNLYKMFIELKKLGLKIATISSGLQFVSKVLNLDKYVDFVYFNEIEIRENFLTNKFHLKVNEDKLNVFYNLLNFCNIKKENIIFVGDGENDIPISKLSDIFIAVNTEITELKSIAKFELSNLQNNIDLYNIVDFIKKI